MRHLDLSFLPKCRNIIQIRTPIHMLPSWDSNIHVNLKEVRCHFSLAFSRHCCTPSMGNEAQGHVEYSLGLEFDFSTKLTPTTLSKRSLPEGKRCSEEPDAEQGVARPAPSSGETQQYLQAYPLGFVWITSYAVCDTGSSSSTLCLCVRVLHSYSNAQLVFGLWFLSRTNDCDHPQTQLFRNMSSLIMRSIPL